MGDIKERITETFGSIDPQYASITSSRFLLQSIPYDGTSSWGKGADKGLEAFMDAASNMELYDIETDSEVYKQGIHLLPELSGFERPEEMYAAVYKNTKKLLNAHNQMLTFFGGEHSISIGIIKAYYEHYDNLTVLQIDAHTDLRPSYEGSPYNHACAVYDASKNCNLIQVGIRSMDVSEKEFFDPSKCYFMQDMQKYGSGWMDTSIHQMTDDVYITLDLDAFDPSIMPATGTPEPGGMDWHMMTSYLRKVFAERNVVGFDIVELAPIENIHAPQFLVAKLYYKMLSYKAQSINR